MLLPEERPEPIRGGVYAVIKLCDTDPLRVHNELLRRGNEHKLTELNETLLEAVREYKSSLIADLSSNEAVTV